MCIGNQKGVSRLGPLVVSFPSQVINEKIYINFRFFLYSSHVLSKCFSIFENSSEKIGFLGLIYFIFLFFLFAITGLLEGIMIIIIHQNVHEDMSNNTFLCKNWFFQKHNTFYCKIRRASMSHTHEIGGSTQIDTNKPEFLRKLISYEVHTTR